MVKPASTKDNTPPDDPSSAPESGTVREDAGSPPPERADKTTEPQTDRDDPSVAGEER